MVKEFGGLYGLVNNAGVAIDQLTLRYKSEDWDKLMGINLKGTFMLSKAALRPMMKSEDGASIVNMSSVVGLMGNAGQAVYAASKAGLIGMSKSLAREFASRQIRVNCVAPGFIDTDMTRALSEEQRQNLSKEIPLNYLGSVEDVAHGTLYLLSPLSRYVTGQVLSINGGLYM
jgi:3-oxoacyl-[acyl-carrier protein] reductase